MNLEEWRGLLTEDDALAVQPATESTPMQRVGRPERKKEVQDLEPEADGCWPRIEPGEYEAICRKAAYARCWGGRKSLYLRFVIVGPKKDEVELFMACPHPRGKLTYRHKLWVQWALVLERQPNRGERLNKDIFIGKMYRVQVVDTDRKLDNSRRMPDHMQYSVVKTILEVLTGVPEVFEKRGKK